MIYTNDKKTRLTLRLSEEQFDFVKESADQYGVSPSEFLRQVINSTMYQTRRFADTMNKVMTETIRLEKEKESARRENESTIQHNIV